MVWIKPKLDRFNGAIIFSIFKCIEVRVKDTFPHQIDEKETAGERDQISPMKAKTALLEGAIPKLKKICEKIGVLP